MASGQQVIEFATREATRRACRQADAAEELTLRAVSKALAAGDADAAARRVADRLAHLRRRAQALDAEDEEEDEDEEEERQGAGEELAGAAPGATRTDPRVPEDAAELEGAAYWRGLGAAAGLHVEEAAAERGTAATAGGSAGAADAAREKLAADGYFVLEGATDAAVAARLLHGIKLLEEAGYPPAFAFLFDEAWELCAAAWAVAERLLGAPCVLEESLAAFRLRAGTGTEKPAPGTQGGGRHVGTNFGIPHRDYSYADSHAPDGSPSMLSVWLPLNDATLDNGCMNVVPKEFDLHWERDGTYEHKFVMTEGVFGKNTFLHFPLNGVRPLPAPAGTLMGWGGNVIHWGGSCHRAGAADPRTSIAFVFRRVDAVLSPDRILPHSREGVAALTVPQRLHAIAGALAYFMHWYDVPQPLLSVLKRLDCLADLKPDA